MMLLDGDDEPKQTDWAAWFWLGVIVFVVLALSAGLAFFFFAIWRGISV